MKVPGVSPEPSVNPIPSQDITNQPNVPGSEMGNEPDNQEKKVNPFDDQGFDAGIDADEESDPKNYIEKLTGKLAQKLRDYNENETDSDLNKFVINSLIPAAIPSLDDKDTNDVIDKVKSNSDGSQETIPNDDQGDNLDIPNNQENEPVQQEESREQNIDELVSEILGANRTRKSLYKNSPFKNTKFN